MSEDTKTALTLAVNYSATRQHYTLELDEFGYGLGVCDTDAIPVRVKAAVIGDNELPVCRRCVSIARRRGLMPEEA